MHTELYYIPNEYLVMKVRANFPASKSFQRGYYTVPIVTARCGVTKVLYYDLWDTGNMAVFGFNAWATSVTRKFSEVIQTLRHLIL